MASVGHIALGMAAARVSPQQTGRRWTSMVWWSAVSLLPDCDVIGFSMGVQYADPWGHRGATHSLVFAVGTGLAIGVVARLAGRPALRPALLASLLVASHSILDTMTDGGLGCALLWPFDLTRYFAPWRPIPVAPIGLAFFSPYGGIISLTELVLFGPAIALALRTRRANAVTRRDGLLLAVWVCLVWMIASSDPAREAIVGFALREDTAYTAGFSEAAFRSIEPGQSEDEVRRQLGTPFGENWFYSPKRHQAESAMSMSAASILDECITVAFQHGVLTTARDREACRQRGIEDTLTIADVKRLLGPPAESCWRYTWSPLRRRHRMRMVCFLDGRVEAVIRQWN
jgi:inner membrane protein